MVFLPSELTMVKAWVWGKDKLGSSFELVKFEVPESSMTLNN